MRFKIRKDWGKMNQNNKNLTGQLNELAICIDLTNDNEEGPSVKKIVLTSKQNHNGNSSRAEPQPGPSTSRCIQARSFSALNQNNFHCSKCGVENSLTFAQLDCQHRLCYNCLINTLHKNNSTENLCSILRCKKPFSDTVIKDNLSPADYIRYLEHYRDNLRHALQLKTRGLGAGDDLVDLEDLECHEVEDDESIGANNPKAVKCTEVVEIEELLEAAVQNRSNNEFFHLQNLDAESYVPNAEPFECPICFSVLGIGDGVILKNCLHSFCIECLSDYIKHFDEPEVICPYNSELGSCEMLIQEREIRALVSTEVHEKHLSTALKRAEVNLDNVFHCKLPDCIGFVQHQHDSTAFICPVCEKINCIPCKTIHEDETCEQYQDSLLTSTRTREEQQISEEQMKKMIESGEVRNNG